MNATKALTPKVEQPTMMVLVGASRDGSEGYSLTGGEERRIIDLGVGRVDFFKARIRNTIPAMA
jgi:hypothetical protein